MSHLQELENEFRVRERVYAVMIPDMLTQKDDYIANVGIPFSQDRVIMDHYKSRYIEVFLSPVAIARYLADNIDVKIVNRSKLDVIYTDIQLYLAEWEEKVSRSINNIGKPPPSHVIELDNFAKRIHTKFLPAELQQANYDAIKGTLGDNLIRRRKPLVEDDYLEKGEYVTLEQIKRERERNGLRGRRG